MSDELPTIIALDSNTLRNALWQFNEALSLLREARQTLNHATALAEEIDEGLPAMQVALEALAEELG